MFQIRELDHVVLRAADVERLVAFYRDVLGCPVERRQPGLVQLRAGRGLIDLVPATGPGGPGAGNLDHFCLRVEPFEPEAIRAHLLGHGVPVGELARRYGAEGQGPSLYLQDPEGNTVELKGPPDE